MAQSDPVVGLLQVTLRIPDAHSLKDKRRVVRSVIDGAHARFNVSAAEVGAMDEHQRAQLAISAVSGDARHAESVLQHVLNRIEGGEGGSYQLADVQIEWL